MQRSSLLADAISSLHDSVRRFADSGTSARLGTQLALNTLRKDLTELRTKSAEESAKRRRDAAAQEATIRQLRRQLNGQAVLISAFAQQTNASARITAQQLRKRLEVAEQGFVDARTTFERQLRGLDGRQMAVEQRVLVWNLTSVLQRCKKTGRDERQEQELEVLRLRTKHLGTAAAGLRK